MRLKLRDVRDVAEYQLCCGCGACAYLSPDEVELVDTLEYGRRPLLRRDPPRDPRTAEAFAACPGIRLEHTFDRRDPALIPELLDGWGPVREVWEGYAADDEIRFAGSSGGVASALALFCIERLGFHGVLHIAARPDVPYLNHTVMSTTRAEILARTGSRYSPASPCDGLDLIEQAPAPCVFIGKPCDVAALQAARRLRPDLDRKVGLTIAIFCAGTPTTRATLGLLRQLGVSDLSMVESIRYRGNGWPGKFVVRLINGDGRVHECSTSYESSWGLLANDKQWRCHLCPDHTGEFADITVGDPWYRLPQSGEPGRSLIIGRAAACQRLLRTLASYVLLERRDPDLLIRAQPNLLKARSDVFGRLLALRFAGVLTPRCRGLPLFRNWLRIGLRAQVASALGTWRRVGRRQLRTPQLVQPHEPSPGTLADRPCRARGSSVHPRASV